MVAQIYEQLRDAIADGLLPSGYRLTPTRVLATELGISRATVADAYGRLVAEGYAHGRRGGGTVIDTAPTTPTALDSDVTAVRSTPEATRWRRYGSGVTTDVRYDMTPGRVDASLFPLPAWRRCVRASLVDRKGLAAYGDLAGSSQLRIELARWITQSRGIVASPDQIIATQGATQALDLLTRSLLRPGDIAAVEEPGYPPAATNLESHGITVAGVPVDRDGLIVDQIPTGAKLVYVTPSHQYPLGYVLARRRRLALLEWAAANDAVIVEDDYDSEFRHGQRPLEPLHRVDQTGRVIYIGTFSKVLSPTLRLGFMVVPRPLVPTLLTLRQATDFGPPHLTDAAMTTFIAEAHLHHHLRRARRVYTERHTRLRDELDRQAPKSVTVLPGHAGLHLTLLAPNAPTDNEIVSRAGERDVSVSTLRRTYRTT
ncbi:MAG: PLP-dependent aminotransferase family protein, partial [Acidimicrobiia bacterium]